MQCKRFYQPHNPLAHLHVHEILNSSGGGGWGWDCILSVLKGSMNRDYITSDIKRGGGRKESYLKQFWSR